MGKTTAYLKSILFVSVLLLFRVESEEKDSSELDLVNPNKELPKDIALMAKKIRPSMSARSRGCSVSKITARFNNNKSENGATVLLKCVCVVVKMRGRVCVCVLKHCRSNINSCAVPPCTK